MSSSLALKELNKSLVKQASTVTLIKEQKKTQWWQVLLNVIFSGLSIIVETVATSLLGPVGGMLVGIGADITFNILGDIVYGNDPWSLENVMFNVVMPLASIPTKINSIRKIYKSGVYAVGEATENLELEKLARLLNKSDISDDFVKNGMRKYQHIINKISMHPEDLKRVGLKHFQSISHTVESYEKSFNGLKKFNKILRNTQKALSFIDDPNKIQKTFFKLFYDQIKLTDVIKLSKHKLFKKFKTIKTKFFKSTEKVLKNKSILLPLNHTVAPWILGIKLWPVKGTFNYFNITVVFNAALTNNKKSVMLYNKSWKSIRQWLLAPSAGSYYINNISWGWDVGKMLRNNNELLSAFRTLPFVSELYQSFYLSYKTIDKAISIIEKIANGEIIEKWRDGWQPTNIASNFAKTTISLFGGPTNAIVRTLETGKVSYIAKYGRRKVKKKIHKSAREYWKEVQNGKYGSIGYGRYRYTIHKN